MFQPLFQILGEFGHVDKETMPCEIVKELESTCLLSKLSDEAIIWMLSAMLKLGIRSPEVVSDINIQKLRQGIKSENIEGVQVCIVDVIHNV